jgi:hypothetical protein
MPGTGLMTGNISYRRPLFALAIIMFAMNATVTAAAGSRPETTNLPEMRRTAIPGSEATPTPTVVPRPLVPGVPPRAIAITAAGCCSYPGWSRDSEWVLYFDAPEGAESSGLYSIPRAGGPATLLTHRIGVYSTDWSLVAYPEDGRVYIERWQDGERWTVPSAGREINFSPSALSIAWEIGSSSIQNPDVQVRSVWISDVRGRNPRELVTLHGGRLIGWSQDDEALIVSGRLTPTGPAGIWRIEVENGAGRLLFDVDDPREALLSTDGSQLAFIVAFETGPDRNGLWILQTNGDGARRLDFFGAYRWRSTDQLVVFPYDLSSSSPYLVQYDTRRDLWWSLSSPRFTQLPIANNDWQISPDGAWLVYQSYTDQSLYLLELPDPPEVP